MEEKLYYKFNETLTKEDYVAFAKKLPSFKSIKILYGVLIVLCAIVLALNVMSGVSQPSFQLLVFVPMMLILLLMVIFFPHLLGKKLYQNAAKINSVSGEIAFCEESIYDTDANGFKKFQYSQIDKVLETDTHYFLFFSKTMGMILQKSAMTYGDSDFVAFINSKKAR